MEIFKILLIVETSDEEPLLKCAGPFSRLL